MSHLHVSSSGCFCLQSLDQILIKQVGEAFFELTKLCVRKGSKEGINIFPGWSGLIFLTVQSRFLQDVFVVIILLIIMLTSLSKQTPLPPAFMTPHVFTTKVNIGRHLVSPLHVFTHVLHLLSKTHAPMHCNVTTRL